MKDDFGHLLDFLQHLRKLKVSLFMFGLKHKDIVHSVLFMGSVVPLLQWLLATTVIRLFFVVKIFSYTENIRKYNL